MRFLLLGGPVLGSLAFCLAACTLPPPSPAQRAAAADESKSGGTPDAPGPAGVLVHGAPGDDVASPLRCRLDGPDVNCTRDR